MTYKPKSSRDHEIECQEIRFENIAQYERILESLNITVRLKISDRQNTESEVIVAFNGKSLSNYQASDRTAVDVLFTMLGGCYDSTTIRQMNNYLAYRGELNLPSPERVKRAIADTEKGSK